MAFEYEFRMRIEAPRPTVFERLLRIEHLSRWFCGWSRVEPKVGGSFKFGGETCIIPPEGRSWDTTIDEGEVLRRFAFRWAIRSSETRVSYELEDEPDGMASLVVRHRGVPIRETTCGTVEAAWRMCLGNRKASGTAVYLAESGLPTGGLGLVLHERGRWSDRLVCLKNFVESGSSGFVNAYEDQVRES